MNERLCYLKWALTDLIIDLTINTEVFRDYVDKSGFNSNNPKDHALIRMVCNSLVINLCKLAELIRHFGKEINGAGEQIKTECNTLVSLIDKKGIYQFRSKYVAHAIDKETKLPISVKLGKEKMDEIFGKTVGDLDIFCSWVCPKPECEKSGSVVQVITSLRDYCKRLEGQSGQRP